MDRLEKLEHLLDLVLKDDNGTCSCEMDIEARKLLAERKDSK